MTSLNAAIAATLAALLEFALPGLAGLIVVCLLWVAVSRRRKRAVVETAVLQAWDEQAARHAQRRRVRPSVPVVSGRARVPVQRSGEDER